MSSSTPVERREPRRQGIVFALVGPAGVGKTTFCRRLLEDFPGTIRLSVSATTRAPRPGEIDGVSKHFLTREQFEQQVRDGSLFEWEEVHGNLYGTLRKTLDDSVYAGTDLLLDIDIRGALKFKQQLPACTAICFVVQPSIDALSERILNRSPISTEELAIRLETAREEYRAFIELVKAGGVVDYMVVNHDRDHAYQQVRAQLVAERSKVSRFELQDIQAICGVCRD